MIINILHLIKGHNETIEINSQIPNFLSELNGESIDVSGILYIDNGALKADLRIKTKVGFECARCIEEFVYPLDFQVNESYDLVEDQGILQNEMLDLTELLRESIFMNLPIKPLCNQDCKGLCAECGTNLNVQTCKCNEEQVDPRLSVLDLLNGDE